MAIGGVVSLSQLEAEGVNLLPFACFPKIPYIDLWLIACDTP